MGVVFILFQKFMIISQIDLFTHSLGMSSDIITNNTRVWLKSVEPFHSWLQSWLVIILVQVVKCGCLLPAKATSYIMLCDSSHTKRYNKELALVNLKWCSFYRSSMFCNSTKPAPETRSFRREAQFLLLLCNKRE